MEACQNFANEITGFKAESAKLKEKIEEYELGMQAAQVKNEEWGQGILTISAIIQMNQDKLDDIGNPVITPDIQSYLLGLRFHFFLHSQGLRRLEELLEQSKALLEIYEDRILVVEEAQELVEELGDNEATISEAIEARMKEVIEAFIDVEESIMEQVDSMA